MRNDVAEKVRAEFQWDEVREQRLFNRVLVESAAPRIRAGRRSAFIAAAASVVLVLSISLIRRYGRNGSVAMQLAARTASAARIMIFSDGSKGTLSSDAAIRASEDRPEAVRILQTAGEVLYEVTRDPSRPFVVRVGDVEVRVRGTVFRVGVVNEWVDVRVDRGRVEVDDGTRTTMLTPGESLHVHAWNVAAAIRSEPTSNPVNPSITTAPDPDPPATSRSASNLRRSSQTRSVLSAALSADELLARADAARHAARWDDAAEVLEAFLAHNPHDARFAGALFTLGRVERNRGRPAAAALVFARCQGLAATGAINEDALAEEAISWHLAGDRSRTNAAVQRYISAFPNGGHVGGMRALLE